MGIADAQPILRNNEDNIMLKLDHLTVIAPSLAEGVEHVRNCLDLDVPFVFRLFKSKAVEVIEREVRVWIDKAKRGELSGATGS